MQFRLPSNSTQRLFSPSRLNRNSPPGIHFMPVRFLPRVLPRLSNGRQLSISRLRSASEPGRPRFPRLRLLGFSLLAIPFGLTATLGGLLLFDAFTYQDEHIGRVPVSPIALEPRRGGPKNLPVATVLLSDEESDEALALAAKPKLVIVGGGWAAVSVIKSLTPGDYHVTLVSPDNFNLFTPLLPSATVGTVEPRTLVEPLRRVLARVHGQFLCGVATDVDMKGQLLEVANASGDGEGASFYLPYDKLIVACGSTTSTHGVPGLQHTHQLKTISDARNIRRKIMNNLEEAALPTTSVEMRKKLLSFVVCGGGATGTEFASELYDMINEDLIKYFPKHLRNVISVHIIQSRDHLLNTYAESISQYAEKRFARDEIDTILNARVSKVEPDKIYYTIKEKSGQAVEKSIDCGFVLWSTGIAMQPLTKRLAQLLPNQYHRKALEVDNQLRVKGAPLGTIYAIGDCATIETNLVDHLMELVDQCDADKNGRIDQREWGTMASKIKKQFPLAAPHMAKLKELFEKYDSDHDQSLSLNELASLFADLSSKITSLPATAQVASQQGKYLGSKLSALSRLQDQGLDNSSNPLTAQSIEENDCDPFTYRHMGTLAYISGSAAIDVGNGRSFTGGLIAMYMWRSIYWSEQCSNRTRVLLLVDWIKRGIFGRDLSKI